MKAKILIVAMGFVGSMFTSSCDNYLDINNDPDSPSEGQMTEAVCLPGILAQASYVGLEQGNYLQSFWMLQNTSMGTNAGGPEHFIISPSDLDNNWGIYIYSIKNTVILKDIAVKNKNYWYEGVADVILAHQFSLLTDMFGDIPYSEAIKYFDGINQPKFDSQEKIYADLIVRLDKAIANLSKPKGTQKQIGQDDLIYGGNVEKWAKFAHSLKARLYLRMVYRDKSNAQKALTEAGLGITDPADNALFRYGTSAKAEGFWNQFAQNWTWYGNLYPSKYFVDVLNGLKDPRRAALFTEGKDDAGNPAYIGIVSGNGLDDDSNVSHWGATLMAKDKPAEFISNVEIAFIKAEALLLNGSSVTDVQNALNAAITADMKSLGVKDADIADYLSKSEINLSLAVNDEARQKMIVTQKYIALYMENSEAYNDWRRTGYPSFTEQDWSSSMNFGGGVHHTAPNRFPYPAIAIQRNVNTPSNINSWTAKVWWDNKDKANLAK